METNSKFKKRKYNSVHMWLKNNHTKTGICSNTHCDTGYKKTEWALIHGKEHENNIDNYMEMCIPCHKRYDMTDERRRKFSIAKMGNKYCLGKKASVETKRKQSQAKKGKTGVHANRNSKIVCINGDERTKYYSISEASRMLGIGITSINNCLRGKSKSSGGMRWEYSK